MSTVRLFGWAQKTGAFHSDHLAGKREKWEGQRPAFAGLGKSYHAKGSRWIPNRLYVSQTKRLVFGQIIQRSNDGGPKPGKQPGTQPGRADDYAKKECQGARSAIIRRFMIPSP